MILVTLDYLIYIMDQACGFVKIPLAVLAVNGLNITYTNLHREQAKHVNVMVPPPLVISWIRLSFCPQNICISKLPTYL